MEKLQDFSTAATGSGGSSLISINSNNSNICSYNNNDTNNVPNDTGK